jgi:hypothetical protein
MTRYEKHRHEMFQRVRDFGNAHRQEFPDGSMGAKAFRNVEAAIAQIEANATAKVLTAEEGKKAKAAARLMLVDCLTTITRTARVLAKGQPGSDAVFQVPIDSSDLALLTAARAFITECQKALDRFVLLGLPKTFVTELQELTDSFEQAVHGRRAGRTGRVAAQAGLKLAQALGMDAIRTLDIVVTNTLKGDHVSLTTWKRDRVIDPKSKAASAGAKVPVVPANATTVDPPPPSAPAVARGQSHFVSGDRPLAHAGRPLAGGDRPLANGDGPLGEEDASNVVILDDVERKAS